MHPIKHSLAVLFVAALTGLAACSLPQSGDGEPGVTGRPVSPTAAVSPDGDGGPDPYPQPPGQSILERKVMLPFVIHQPTPPAAMEIPVDASCTDADPHPIGLSIAGTYAVSYQQVMTWFCSGYSFENILVALETGEAVGLPADTLLQMLLEKEWEEIWDELGFVEDR